jgi:thymidylate synthase ThyX
MMKVTGLALCPPPAAEGNPKVTPELLASCLARYSRSNKGIDAILSAIDWSNPDKSVDAIFRFVDYGHASIGGMTGGIAMVVDHCSMFLAYKLFEFAQLADGQESSTRYIELGPANLPSPAELGIPAALAGEWQRVMEHAFHVYREVYDQLDLRAKTNPELVRVPKGADQKVRDRLRRNFALDRARYFIPLATRTNVALVMTARVWAQTIRQLAALPQPEARACAGLLRAELRKFAPRLIRHSEPEQAAVLQQRLELGACCEYIRQKGVGLENLKDEVYVALERSFPSFLPSIQDLAGAFAGKTNRYSLAGEALRRTFVRFAWNNMTLAELRDLNRHRSGCRFSLLNPVGFYVPPEVKHPGITTLLGRQKRLVEKLVQDSAETGCHYYAYLLGVQTPFEHSTHADKFIYEVELRTGLGAHFRYAEHLAAAAREFLKLIPQATPFIQIGTAEPE